MATAIGFGFRFCFFLANARLISAERNHRSSYFFWPLHRRQVLVWPIWTVLSISMQMPLADTLSSVTFALLGEAVPWKASFFSRPLVAMAANNKVSRSIFK